MPEWKPMAATATPKLITVFGATGTVGRELVAELASAGHHVRAVLRSPDRPLPHPLRHRPAIVGYVVAGDDPESIRRACLGADAVFVLTATDPRQVETECAIIDGAAAAAANRIVKLSAPLIPGAPAMIVADWHRQVEAHLAATPVESVSLRPMAFSQNWLRNTFPITHLNLISGSAGTAPRSYVDARDVAAIAALALVAPDRPPARALTISGPEALSYDEVAERLSVLTGRHIRYENLDPGEHHRRLRTRVGLPTWLADHIVELDTLARTVPDAGSTTVSDVLGRPARSFDEFLHENRAAFARPAVHRRLVGLLMPSKPAA